jgi:hypothetical protein
MDYKQPTTGDEHTHLLECEEADALQKRVNQAMDAGCCPGCNSPSGMMDWLPCELIADGGKGIQFYTHQADDVLYTSCWQCNPTAVIPDGYVPLVGTVGEWLERRRE